MTTASQPQPDKNQLRVVIEGVTRSLTHFSNVFDRMRRHHREDYRENLDSHKEIKAMIVKGHLDDQKRQKEFDEKIQDVMHEVLRNRAAFNCWDNQEDT